MDKTIEELDEKRINLSDEYASECERLALLEEKIAEARLEQEGLLPAMDDLSKKLKKAEAVKSQRMMVCSQDALRLREKITRKEAEIQACQAQISDALEREAKAHEAAQSNQAKIRETQDSIQSLEAKLAAMRL